MGEAVINRNTGRYLNKNKHQYEWWVFCKNNKPLLIATANAMIPADQLKWLDNSIWDNLLQGG
jgi:hypothetical protein